jgi:O-acetyl-ADP-ribose deacetylase (regulator of RNase III)
MIKYVKGNLLALAERGELDIIVHGCNCQNTMGSGIAKQIKDRYPTVWEADCDYERELAARRYNKLGNYTLAKVYNKPFFYVVNAYTQYEYLPRGVDHFEYASFAVILQKLAHFYGNYDFGFPYIGMGLAGGDSERIIAMLEEFSELVEAKGGSVTLVEYVS